MTSLERFFLAIIVYLCCGITSTVFYTKFEGYDNVYLKDMLIIIGAWPLVIPYVFFAHLWEKIQSLLDEKRLCKKIDLAKKSTI